MALEGGCICGKTRYTTSNDPLFVHACHCLDCQRLSGSAFVVLMGVVKSEFKLEGELTTVTNPTPSGAGYDAHLCAACATIIWSKYHFVVLPIIAVRAGTLDDPGLAPPQYHIFCRSKQPWVTLPSGVLEFEGWLDAGQAWSSETLSRMEALGQPTQSQS